MTAVRAGSIERINSQQATSQIYKFGMLTVEDHKDISPDASVLRDNILQIFKYETSMHSREFTNSKSTNNKIKNNANQDFNKSDEILQFNLYNSFENQKKLLMEWMYDEFVYDEYGKIISLVVPSQNSNMHMPTAIYEEENKKEFYNKDEVIIAPILPIHAYFV